MTKNFKELEGLTLKNIEGCEKDSFEIIFKFTNGDIYKMYHRQDCCEEVNPPSEYSDSHTWTFYHIHTTKVYLWLRWLGTSNGYYSEAVNLEKIN